MNSNYILSQHEIAGGKFIRMKNYLTTEEKEVVLVLNQIPKSGIFNDIVLNALKENKADRVRATFRMIRDQVNSCGKNRIYEAIGSDATNAVLKLFY
jgi:hypothetical protein